MVAAGTLPENVLAWHEGLPEWVPLSDLVPPQTHAPQSSAPVARVARPVSTSFARRLPGAFAYPLQKDGLILLVAGTLFFWLIGLAGMFAGVISLVLAVFSGGYLAVYLQSIVQSSAQGEDGLPRWPEFTDWYQDIIVPFLQFTAVTLVCLGPGMVLLQFGSREGEEPSREWLGWALLGVGALYLPMALLAVAMSDSLGGLSPTVVIPGILKVPGHYALTCAVLGGWSFLNGLLDHLFSSAVYIPVVTALIQGFVALYALTVQARVLGLLYLCNRDRLRWF